MRRALEARKRAQQAGAAFAHRAGRHQQAQTACRNDGRRPVQGRRRRTVWRRGEHAARRPSPAAEPRWKRIEPLDAAGKPADDGRSCFVSISMSNATQEFSTFKKIADDDKRQVAAADDRRLRPGRAGDGRVGRSATARPWEEADAPHHSRRRHARSRCRSRGSSWPTKARAAT